MSGRRCAETALAARRGTSADAGRQSRPPSRSSCCATRPPGRRSSCCGGSRSMAFAAGMTVFPGGAVDARDADHRRLGLGRRRPVADVAALLGADEPRPARCVCAAVRETFEESGVLLAGPSRGPWSRDTDGPDWEADRIALERRDLVARRAPGPARPGAAGRPAPALGALDHAGGRARAGTTPASSSPRCRPASAPGTSRARPTRSPGCARRDAAGPAAPRRAADDAADDRHAGRDRRRAARSPTCWPPDAARPGSSPRWSDGRTVDRR